MIDTAKLKEKILDLAIRGKLVPQDPNDEPASVLLEKIRAEKLQMVKEGKLKQKDIKDDAVIFVGEDNLHYEKFGDGSIKCIEDEIPFEIPKSWAWTRLGNIGTWGAGATPSRSNPEYYKGNIPWLKTGDLNDGYIIDIPEKISQTALDETSVKLNPSGSVLIAMYGATIGKLGILTYPATTNQACCACISYNGINNIYLFYFLMSQRKEFIDLGVGGAQSNISKEKIINTLIPIPSNKEQNNIVKQIKQYLAYLQNLDLNKHNLQELIKLLKSKILDLAIRGKLVPQDPNDEPADVLLENIRKEKEEQIKQGKIKKDKKESIIFKGDDNSYYGNLPKNWTLTTLKEITNDKELNDGDWIVSDDMVDSGPVKLIQLGSVGFMNYIEKGFKYLTLDTFKRLNCSTIKENYLLINRIISDKMCCCMLPKIDGTLITTVDTCWISPNDNHYNIKYLMFVLSSPLFQSEVIYKSSGTTRKRISKLSLIDIQFPFPPIEEQNKIIDKVENIFKIIENIANAIK